MTNEWGQELNATMTDTLDYTRRWVETTESRMGQLQRQKEQLLTTSSTQIHLLIGEFNTNVHTMVIKVEECLRKWESTFQSIQQLSKKATDGERSDLARRPGTTGITGFRRIGMAAAAGFKLIGTAAGLRTMLTDADQHMTEAIVGLNKTDSVGSVKKIVRAGAVKKKDTTADPKPTVGLKKTDTVVVERITTSPITAPINEAAPMSNGLLDNLNKKYEELKTDCKKSQVKNVDAFKLLLKAVGELIATDKSIIGSLEMSDFINRVISSGQAFLEIFKLSKYFSVEFVTGITKQSVKQRIEPDIYSLEGRTRMIQKHIKDLSQSILTQLHNLNKTLKVGDHRGNQIKFKKFINELDNNFHKITDEIEQCQRLLSSMETKIQENSKKNKDMVDAGVADTTKVDTGAGSMKKMGSAFVMGGLKAMGSVVVAVHPVTFAAGVAGFGIVQSVRITRRKIIKKTTEKLGKIKTHLQYCYRQIKSHTKR